MTDKEDEIYDYACEDQLAPPRGEGTEEKSIIRELIKQISPSQELYSLSMPAFVMRRLYQYLIFRTCQFIGKTFNLCNSKFSLGEYKRCGGARSENV
jgi:hypothetical protein